MRPGSAAHGTGWCAIDMASQKTDRASGALAVARSSAARRVVGSSAENLDQIASTLTVAIVAQQVTNGGAVMPAFKGKLSPAQIQAVAKYVSSSAGK